MYQVYYEAYINETITVPVFCKEPKYLLSKLKYMQVHFWVIQKDIKTKKNGQP